jgi:hypothetical protein
VEEEMKGKGFAGISGSFRFIRQRGIDAAGRPLQLEDLLLHGADGEWSPRVDPLQDLRSKNKITKRGLSAFMHRALIGHPGGPYVPTDIVISQTTNPFPAFFMAADHPEAIPPKAGDARVKWAESDGAYDARVPVNPALPGKGVRAILISDTTGPGMKRNSIAYPTTAPYREIEYVFFAQANTPTYATGSVTVPAGSTGGLNGSTFTLPDGINDALTFEFDSDASVAEWDGDPANHVPIRFAGTETADQMRDLTIAVVNSLLATTLFITASNGGSGIVSLAHDTGGAIGAKTITHTGGTLTVSGMTGGTALEIADDYIDNLPIKAVGLAAGIQCGDGEADSLVGVRSVIGLPPLLQGISDRVYVHESTSLYKYVLGDLLGDGHGAGYYQTSNEDVTERSVATAVGDQIWASDKRVRMKNGNFTAADEGRTLDISGSGAGNNGAKRIVTVLTSWDVLVLEAVSNETAGFAAQVVTVSTGDGAFDGNVEAEASTGVVDLGERKWRSVDVTGPHELARIWAADQNVHGVRIVLPPGTPKDNCLNTFKIQFLDASKVGGDPNLLEPAQPLHWTDVGAEVDFTGSGKATEIFDGGERGYEFRFNSPRATRGIKITSGQAFVTSKAVEVAEFYIMEELASITFTAGVDDAVKLATSGAPTGPGTPGPVGVWRTFSFGSLVTSGSIANNDVQTVADALNKQLRGYGLEAIRSQAGFLWIRATVAGYNSQLDKVSTAAGGTANAKLGLSTSQEQKTGLTQVVRKLPLEALTIIYRVNVSGDLPVA